MQTRCRGPAKGRWIIAIANTDLRFAIVGAGRLGASLALALADHGATLTGFTADTLAGRTRAEGWLGGSAGQGISDLVATAPDVYFIAVPDQALPDVAAELGEALGNRPSPTASEPRQGPSAVPMVAHTSGATSVSVLRPCADAGAGTLVFHPLQTFSDPPTGRTRFVGAGIAITPGSSGGSPGHSAPSGDGAQDFGSALAHMLGARPFFLADDKRALYHAAATFACNYLVTLEDAARRLFVQAGLPSEEALPLFLPLVQATLTNLETQGAEKALTGPLSRGDSSTIASHLQALAEDAPHLLPLYRALGVATLDLVRAIGGMEDETLEDLVTLLRGPAPTGVTDAPISD